MAGTIEIFEGVDKPETEETVLPPQALIKLREIIIKNFFIDLSDFVIMNKRNNQKFVGFVTGSLKLYNYNKTKSRNSLVGFA